VNLLLLEADELDEDGHAVLRGRRAQHLQRVLRVSTGQELKAGCLNRSVGSARVEAIAKDHVTVRYSALQQLQPPARRALLLAMPRPKVLSRCLEHAAALGFTTIALFRCFRVDKSHLQSHKRDADDTRAHLVLGLEQGSRVFMPELLLFDRFKPFVEDALEGVASAQNRFVAHPAAAVSSAKLQPQRAGYTLALGPEGGLLPYEVAAFEEHGFGAFRADTGALRVESALSYFAGQLDLLCGSTP
jgi:16S rRNA (uracil1498-N3)-methyltransferase